MNGEKQESMASYFQFHGRATSGIIRYPGPVSYRDKLEPGESSCRGGMTDTFGKEIAIGSFGHGNQEIWVGVITRGTAVARTGPTDFVVSFFAALKHGK